ncbi:MAG: MutS-related protein [Flavobacterium sp.]
MSSKVHEINQHFKMPIYYNEQKTEVDSIIIKDLELTQTVDTSGTPIYEFCFDNDNDISKKLNEQICSCYTTDVSFLKDTQMLLRTYKPLGVKYTDYSSNYKHIVDIWNELKLDAGFKEKYYYVEWEMLSFLNRSEWFLQCMSIYNLLSPIISLLVPIIILIIPFFIIKLKGLSITITEYIDVLKLVASQNAIGKLFVVNFGDITAQEKIYICISAAFYLFSIYQNFMVCVRFNNNMKTIHNHFHELRIYLDHTIHSMENYLQYADRLVSHQAFNAIAREKLELLRDMKQCIHSITDYNMFNISKVQEIGYVFKCFYELHTDQQYDDVLMYSLGFNGYMDCLKGLQVNLAERKMGYAKLRTSSTKTVFKHSYYAPLKRAQPVTNTIRLDKHMIITGPNASGKTTVLKSTLINILFTQQFGCGFYASASLAPYHHLHCYLNIPDTSGRDSLFQAEARRCKMILDRIRESKSERHFCVFDELYSGTNPEEAEQSAISFMRYITKYKQVRCMLTTHFVKVCEQLDKLPNIANCKMLTNVSDDTMLLYTYQLTKGISEIKGGLMVLKQLDYPEEMIKEL